MNNRIVNVICFAAGAGIGFFAACKMMRSAFAELAQEEIDSVKEVYMRRLEELEEEATDEEVAEVVNSNPTKPSIKEYAAGIEGLYESKEKEESVDMSKPEVISPEEFGNIPGYYEMQLEYYDNGIVVDEDGVELTEQQIEDMIGHESLTTFGEYEDDSVFVRNDELETYFEILAMRETYTVANVEND